MIVGSLLLIVIAVGLLVVGLLQGANALLVASIAASLLAAIALIVGGRQVAATRGGSRSEARTGTRRASRLDSRVDSRVDAHTDAHTDSRFDSRLDEDLADVESGDELRRSRRAERQTVGAGIGAGGSNGSVADETSLMAPVRDVDPYAPAIPQQQHDDDRYQGASSSSSMYEDDDDDYEDDEDPEDEPPAQQTSAADAARIAAMSAEVFVIDGRPRYHLRGCVHMLGRDSEPLPVGEAIELGFSPCSVCEPDSSLLAAARRV